MDPKTKKNGPNAITHSSTHVKMLVQK